MTATLPLPFPRMSSRGGSSAGPMSPEMVLSCFEGDMPRKRGSLTYALGLLVVAIAMLLLPLIYLAIIAAAGWVLVWHVQNNIGVVHVHSALTLIEWLLLYLTPAIIGSVVVLFLLKPLIAQPIQPSVPFPIFEEDQPALFVLIRRICQLTGAPLPRSVEVDCRVNAAVSLKHGFWGLFLPLKMDLVIGLPLVAGLTLPQFSGLLAHEFGHFTQGLGLRLGWLIMSINGWLARTCLERDKWDVWLHHMASSESLYWALSFSLARRAVKMSRKVIELLMLAGHGISAFMSRQQEYDADRCAILLAGSDTFAALSRRSRELGAGDELPLHALLKSLAGRRIPEDYPAYILGRLGEIPPATLEKIVAEGAKQETQWYDIHPSQRDRLAAARHLAQSGVFHADAPASAVFHGFPVLCKLVTEHFYEDTLGLPLHELTVVPGHKLTAEAHAQDLIQNELESRLGTAAMKYATPIACRQPVPWGNMLGHAAHFEAACAYVSQHRTAAANAMAEYVELDERNHALDVAGALVECGFPFYPGAFGLNVASMDEVNRVRGSITVAQAPHVAILQNYHAATDAALAMGLALHAIAFRHRVEPLVHLLQVLAWAAPSLHRAWSLARAMQSLGQNAHFHPDPTAVQTKMHQLAWQIESLVTPLESTLRGTPLPYEHAQGEVSVWTSVFPDLAAAIAQDPVTAAYESARLLVSELEALYLRVLGELCARANLRHVQTLGTDWR